MLLTDGSKMIRTPTYWVYDMYKPWQDATVLPIELDTPWYGKGQFTMPAVSGSAVRGKDGKVRGLHNICTHRGNKLVPEGRGNAGHFTCRFHGWAFHNDGRLAVVTDDTAVRVGL